MTSHSSKKLLTIAAVIVLISGISWYAWHTAQSERILAGVASGNGRIEATEYDIATKLAGRVLSVAAQEGGMVEAGQVLATWRWIRIAQMSFGFKGGFWPASLPLFQDSRV